MEKLNFTPFPIMETKRLMLRQASNHDKNEIFFLKSDDEVLKYLDNQKHKSVVDSEKFILNIIDGILQNQWIHWAINLKNNDKLIGTICLWNISIDSSDAEIGYELMPSYQGVGIMDEALKAVVEYSFNVVKFNSLTAYIHENNLKSINLLESNGFNELKDETIDYVNNLLKNNKIYKLFNNKI